MYLERVCLNCKHWQAMLNSSNDEMICRLTKRPTDPTDSCSHFEPKSTFDSLSNPERFLDKRVLK